MDEFALYDRTAFVAEIYRLRKIVAGKEAEEETDELTRLLNSERDLLQQQIKQMEGEHAAATSDLQSELADYKWCTVRHETRAEAFREVIRMMLEAR